MRKWRVEIESPQSLSKILEILHRYGDRTSLKIEYPLWWVSAILNAVPLRGTLSDAVNKLIKYTILRYRRYYIVVKE